MHTNTRTYQTVLSNLNFYLPGQLRRAKARVLHKVCRIFLIFNFIFYLPERKADKGQSPPEGMHDLFYFILFYFILFIYQTVKVDKSQSPP
jgi:hypothetical protein